MLNLELRCLTKPFSTVMERLYQAITRATSRPSPTSTSPPNLLWVTGTRKTASLLWDISRRVTSPQTKLFQAILTTLTALMERRTPQGTAVTMCQPSLTRITTSYSIPHALQPISQRHMFSAQAQTTVAVTPAITSVSFSLILYLLTAQAMQRSLCLSR